MNAIKENPDLSLASLKTKFTRELNAEKKNMERKFNYCSWAPKI